MIRQLELNLKIIPTDAQLCMMCHFSSECAKCCAKCLADKGYCGNGSQVCSKLQPKEEQIERLEAWLHLIKNNPSFKRLKKYLV